MFKGYDAIVLSASSRKQKKKCPLPGVHHALYFLSCFGDEIEASVIDLLEVTSVSWNVRAVPSTSPLLNVQRMSLEMQALA